MYQKHEYVVLVMSANLINRDIDQSGFRMIKKIYSIHSPIRPAEHGEQQFIFGQYLKRQPRKLNVSCN